MCDLYLPLAVHFTLSSLAAVLPRARSGAGLGLPANVLGLSSSLFLTIFCSLLTPHACRSTPPHLPLHQPKMKTKGERSAAAAALPKPLPLSLSPALPGELLLHFQLLIWGEGVMILLPRV